MFPRIPATTRTVSLLSGVLLLACGSSTSGGDRIAGTDGPGAAGADLEPCELGATVFDPAAVLEYHVTLDPTLYEDLKANGNDEVYRTAALQVRGGGVSMDFDAVGLRYKGDYSLNHCWDDFGGIRSYQGECAKLSMKLKFNEVDPEGRFFGLKRLNLNSMSYDDTKLRERLVYSLFNDFGVSTARTAYAKLYINDEPPLLVVAVEAIDGRFTACRNPGAGDGDLYKEVWPRPAMSEDALRESLRTNDDLDDDPDLAAFLQFGEAVGSATETTFADVMAGFVDLEPLLRYMAVDRATKNWDGITAFYWPERPHNFYWYHDDVGQGLFHLIPWDLDQTMWDYDPYMDPVNRHAERRVPNWNVKPLSCDPISVWESGGEVTVIPSGCDPLIHLLAATSWDVFVPFGAELLEGPFTFDAMNQQVTAWADQIAPAVEEDPFINRQAWESQVEYFRGVLQKNIEDFRAHLEEGYIVEE